MAAMRRTHVILVEELKETDHLGELSIDGRIILRWILDKQDKGVD
jgi:hypothetical protein